jgi:hypothetical protein
MEQLKGFLLNQKFTFPFNYDVISKYLWICCQILSSKRAWERLLIIKYENNYRTISIPQKHLV